MNLVDEWNIYHRGGNRLINRDFVHARTKSNINSANSPYLLRRGRHKDPRATIVGRTEIRPNIHKGVIFLVGLQVRYVCSIANSKSKYAQIAKRVLQDDERFRDEVWLRTFVPVCQQSIQTLFVHVSEKDPNKIAYYENEDKFLRDIQTQISPGRYYKKVAPETSDEEIKAWVDNFRRFHGEATFKTSDKEEDFVRVYRTGPRSCMSLEYKDEDHPVRVYAAGDIEICWLEKGDRIVARCLAKKEGKVAGRIFGDSPLMEAMLEKNGYTQKDGALHDCRLQKITNSGGEWLMPYIDRALGMNDPAWVYDDGEYWVIDTRSGGEDKLLCDKTSGVLPDKRARCAHCGEPTDENELRYIEYEDQEVCERCLAHYYTWADDVEDYVPKNQTVYCESRGECYTLEYAKEHLKQCEHCMDWLDQEDTPMKTATVGKLAGYKLCPACWQVDYLRPNDIFYRGEGCIDQYTGEIMFEGNAILSIAGAKVHIDSCYMFHRKLGENKLVYVHPKDFETQYGTIHALLCEPGVEITTAKYEPVSKKAFMEMYLTQPFELEAA